MRTGLIKSLTLTLLFCAFAEASAFSMLVSFDVVQGRTLRQAFQGRIAMHPLAPKTIIPLGSFDPIVGYHAQANAKLGNLQFNAHGFIANGPDGASPEGYPDKPAGVFRIILLGSSTLAGNALRSDASQTIAAHLERLLNASAKDGRKYQVLNFGASGGYSFSELRLFFSQVIHLKPDAVISLDGWTDAVEGAFAAERSGLDHGLIDWTQPIYQQYDYFLGLSAQQKRPPAIFTYMYLLLDQIGVFGNSLPPMRPRRYADIPWYQVSADIIRQHGGLQFVLPRNIEAMAAFCKETGIYFIGYLQPFAAYLRAQNEEEQSALTDFHAALVQAGDTYWEPESYRKRIAPYYSSYRAAYSELSQKYLRTHNVRFFDITDLFSAVPERIYLDISHYNERGNAIIAQRFTSDLTSLTGDSARWEATSAPAQQAQ
jgi:hypothetical protein